MRDAAPAVFAALLVGAAAAGETSSRDRRMTPGTIGIVLIAAVTHALWNIAAKNKRGDAYLFVWEYTTLSAVLMVPIGVAVLAVGNSRLSWSLLLGALVSGLLHVLYSLTLQSGYERSDLSVVYPVARGVGPLLTMIIAVGVLGERPGGFAILGAVVIVAGITVVTGNPFPRGGRSDPAPLLWGAATGVVIAGYTLWDSYSIATLHLAPILYFATTVVIESVALTPGALARRTGLRTHIEADRREIAVVAVLSPLAYVLVLTALRTAPVALVAPLRESSIVVGALLAWWLFHEAHLARRVVGAVTVLAGIAMISLL